jgi:hypothetical protein
MIITSMVPIAAAGMIIRMAPSITMSIWKSRRLRAHRKPIPMTMATSMITPMITGTHIMSMGQAAGMTTATIMAASMITSMGIEANAPVLA